MFREFKNEKRYIKSTNWKINIKRALLDGSKVKISFDLKYTKKMYKYTHVRCIKI